MYCKLLRVCDSCFLGEPFHAIETRRVHLYVCECVHTCITMSKKYVSLLCGVNNISHFKMSPKEIDCQEPKTQQTQQ